MALVGTQLASKHSLKPAIFREFYDKFALRTAYLKCIHTCSLTIILLYGVFFFSSFQILKFFRPEKLSNSNYGLGLIS